METIQPASNSGLLSKKAWPKKIIFVSVGVVGIVVIAIAGMLILGRGNSTDVSDNLSTPRTSTPVLAPGQTNPNIVGFGQTFACESRSEHEYYRTDQTLVVDPQNPDTLYVNVEYRGFHKSMDGGRTWMRLENGIKVYGSSTDPNKPCYGEYPFAVIDPTNSQRVILATSGPGGGTPKDLNALGSGLFESLDGGANFHSMITDDMNGYVSSLTLDPNNPAIVYYGTNSSPASYLEADPNKIYVKSGLVYKFANTWSELPTEFLPYTGATGVHVNPDNSSELVVSLSRRPRTPRECVRLQM